MHINESAENATQKELMIKTNEKNFIVLFGLPGVGKSTVKRNIENNIKNLIYFSLDDYSRFLYKFLDEQQIKELFLSYKDILNKIETRLTEIYKFKKSIYTNIINDIKESFDFDYKEFSKEKNLNPTIAKKKIKELEETHLKNLDKIEDLRIIFNENKQQLTFNEFIKFEKALKDNFGLSYSDTILNNNYTTLSSEFRKMRQTMKLKMYSLAKHNKEINTIIYDALGFNTQIVEDMVELLKETHKIYFIHVTTDNVETNKMNLYSRYRSTSYLEYDNMRRGAALVPDKIKKIDHDYFFTVINSIGDDLSYNTKIISDK